MSTSALFIGNESLLVQCAEHWLGRGLTITAVATRNPDIARWAEGRGIPLRAQAELRSPEGLDYDWLLSVANLSIIPQPLLDGARCGAVNFHDGPLPRHAGLNAPAWAILGDEPRHGITWHMIEGGIDEGDILVSREFEIAPDDTTLTLNARAWEAAVDSFPELAEALVAGSPARRPQDLSQRSYHPRDKRPPAAGRLGFDRPAQDVARLVRALDHGDFANPLALPKLWVRGRLLSVRTAALAEGAGAPGTVLAADDSGLTVACASGAVRLSGLREMDGTEVAAPDAAQLGEVLATAPSDEMARIDAAIAAVSGGEGAFRRALASDPAALPFAQPGQGAADWQEFPLGAAATPSALALWAAQLAGRERVYLAFADGNAPRLPGYLSGWAPLPLSGTGPMDRIAADAEQGFQRARRWPEFAVDLPLRDPAIGPAPMPAIGWSDANRPVPGTVLTVTADGRLLADLSRIDRLGAQLLAARLAHFSAAVAAAAGDADAATIPAMPDSERQLLLTGLNGTACAIPDHSIHRAFEAQAARTPGGAALTHEDRTLTYAQLNARANRLAHLLRQMGVGPGTVVGLNLRRSPMLLVGALGILKAGGAYLPLDPAYPADRIALYVEDSGAPVIITETALEPALPDSDAELLVLDAEPRLAAMPESNPEGGAAPDDLAYLIYTSGSTGRPKGVMLEHGNVANFFAGMDQRIPDSDGRVWLAVTSLSFDISVLELFWTLARGYHVVLMGEEERALVSAGSRISARKMDFSLFYWGNDDGVGRQKYRVLLEGAKFADQHGFCAVWTPERHFHAFGGPYPNPSVTGAAVAAVTTNLEVRAGSCVAPLHHPIRIAEEWAVIDNLTNGRTALGIASGWHPEDFVLRPENGPPNNKAAMFDTIDKLRRMWRGEAVPFPLNDGRMVDVVTQPRPVSRELSIWVTTAGNPATWREAGEIGANVLTHLLGQSVEEVGEKIAIYHDALRKSGRDPADFKVTLMLHSYICHDREVARERARGPMKDYLRSAAALVKQYAWAFPAFKKPQGVTNPMDIDLRSLDAEETEAILDFAFQRYFEDSGLFGTVEDGLARVEQLKRIGVDEIACLIDYGLPCDTVLEGLAPLAEILRRSNTAPELAEGDWSIAAQITRHGATHMQCTPSMARMIAMNDDARAAMGGLRHLVLGGEALPASLVADLTRAGARRITNMYGPTETTIWSTTAPAGVADPVVSIGTPIANTQCYVLDADGQPVPLGAEGELWIGGEGVARGYWQRPDLTEDRFRPNPFASGRIYGTGDLVRWRPDGQGGAKLEFLGRADHQVKLRGYRIELGEIEACAEDCAGVRQAVVICREMAPGDLRLIAYLTGDHQLSTDAVKRHLAERLPPHMVPGHFVRLAEFPLTPNRKVDRKALPDVVESADAVAEDFVAPSDGIEATIAAVWARVLNRPRIGSRDNFFALGGHSLLAVQAHREIRAALGGGVRLSITDIFRFPTLESLAAHLSGGTADDSARKQAEAAEETARADAIARRRALRAQRDGG